MPVLAPIQQHRDPSPTHHQQQQNPVPKKFALMQSVPVPTSADSCLFVIPQEQEVQLPPTIRTVTIDDEASDLPPWLAPQVQLQTSMQTPKPMSESPDEGFNSDSETNVRIEELKETMQDL